MVGEGEGKKSRKERRRIDEFIGLFILDVSTVESRSMLSMNIKHVMITCGTNTKTISKQIFHNKCSQAVSSHHQLLFVFVRIIYFSKASSY